MDIDFYLIKYEKGELVSSPFQNELLFQIAEQGSINIYLIRDDGTRYSLSTGTADHFLGDMDIFYQKNSNIYAEAAERLVCIAFSIEKYKEILFSNNQFLILICNSLSAKIGAIAAMDAIPASLTERVISYMRSLRISQKIRKRNVSISIKHNFCAPPIISIKLLSYTPSMFPAVTIRSHK